MAVARPVAVAAAVVEVAVAVAVVAVAVVAVAVVAVMARRFDRWPRRSIGGSARHSRT